MQKINIINLLRNLPDAAETEQFEKLFDSPGCRIERIVSQGQSSPPGFWYQQDCDEWVLLLSGHAVLLFESQTNPTPLQAGDCLLIPAQARHRVESTDSEHPTIWLAVHLTIKSSAAEYNSSGSLR
jgi:cupin 2 domain-containing protein